MAWPSPACTTLRYLSLLFALTLPARAETVLHLTATASVQTRPDELRASLQTEALGPRPAEIQERVNQKMSGAVAAARNTQGVTLSTGQYSVYLLPRTSQQDQSDRWRGSQILMLTSQDGGTLLKLVGSLQQSGMAVTDLRWALSPDLSEKAFAAAMRKALDSLTGRVKEAAGILSMCFVSFREIRLQSERPPPLPRAMAMAAGAPTPPEAVAEDATITASVEADAVLRPVADGRADCTP